MSAALTVLRNRGCGRRGRWGERGRGRGTRRRFSGAFRSCHESDRQVEYVRRLIPQERNDAELYAWFRRHQPDVVLGHFAELLDWLEGCGAKVPATHGCVSLNVLYKMRPCAGLDQQPRELGARAVELLIAQLQ